MKKILILILTIALCLSFVACGNSEIEIEEEKISEADVIDAFQGCNGILTTEGEADNVTAFKYVITDINVDDLLDREYTKEAIVLGLEDKILELTGGQLELMDVILATMSVELFLFGNSILGVDYTIEDYAERLLSIICDGKTLSGNGWSVSVSVANDSATISAIKD